MRERSCTRFRFSIGRIPLPPDIETVGHTKTGKPDDAAQDRNAQYFAAFRRKHPYLLLEVLEYDESMDVIVATITSMPANHGVRRQRRRCLTILLGVRS